MGGPVQASFLGRRALGREKCAALFASPGPWPGTYDLGGGAKTATLDRSVAERSACELGQVGRARPADIAAPWALAGLEVAVHTREDRAPGSAAETFEGVRGHTCSDRHPLPSERPSNEGWP